MNLHDKVVLVAGGTGGLGREITMAFLEAGASVVVTGRRGAVVEGSGQSKASRKPLRPPRAQVR